MQQPLTALLLATALVACLDDDPTIEVDVTDDLGAEVSAQGNTEMPEDDLVTIAACTVASTDITRSLVVRDAAILAKFSFTRVWNRIRATASISTAQTNRAIYQAWMKTFGATTAAGDCNDATIDPNKYGLVCPRSNELQLATVDPFVTTSTVQFRPVALMNRFDLAPSNGTNCGEYRIVYAMSETHATISGRAFIIFEGTMPNPTPAEGAAGCAPVAQFWHDLTGDGDVNSRATKLERFYFVNNTVPGFPSAVHARHYGLANGATAGFGAGQIRTNFFVNFNQWHLREYKLRRTCTDATDITTCRLRVDHVTVKTNPAEELFAGTHVRSAAFRSAFVNSVPTLARASVNTIAMSIGNEFNEFESVSQTNNVVYRSRAGTAMRDAIRAKLAAIGSPLTVDNILDRATTQTCAGCHQASNVASLGGGLTWPSSSGFVHVSESGALSPAMTSTFLPRRKQVLEAFLRNHCPTRPRVVDGSQDHVLDDELVVAGELTLGGSPVGAAN